MRWLEAFHIIFVVTWFAGIFYLPRLFVYAAENPDGERFELLKVMQRRLMGITHIGGALALAFGISLIVAFPQYLQMGWMHVKFAFVAGLIAYHLYCWKLIGVFARGENQRSSRWYRWFNEIPALILVVVVVMVVVKPF